MKITLLFILLALLSIALTSCTKEVIKPEIKENPGYTEVKPYLQTKRR